MLTNAHNSLASRDACFKCGKPKDASDSMMGGGGGGADYGGSFGGYGGGGGGRRQVRDETSHPKAPTHSPTHSLTHALSPPDDGR